MLTFHSRAYGCFLFILLTFSLNLKTIPAQNFGAVTGTVIDADTRELLPGVNVYLRDTNQGATTGTNGQYRIPRVKPGRYEIVATMIAYKERSTNVTVEEDRTSTVNIEMFLNPVEVGELLVQADRSYSAASTRAIRRFDLQIRPKRSTQDMLRSAPGLIIAQHAGGGKAEQFYLRGFDADHGTDISINVDGMPVNMVSHGHGQGYADLHFVIPEIVDEMEVFKGPYFAEYGNFATAGAIEFHTKDHIDQNMVKVEGGSYETQRITTLFQIPTPTPNQNAYFAGEFYRTNGPFENPLDLNRFNVYGKFHTHIPERGQLTLAFSGFNSAWNASGQIPLRGVESGYIGRWGTVDDSEGGATGRQNVNLTYRMNDKNGSSFMTQAYFSKYDFRLFSNFTYFLEDPVNGDLVEQSDDRNILGLRSTYKVFHTVGGMVSGTTIGGGYRADNTDLALWHSPHRQRMNNWVNARVLERNLFLWAQEELVVNPKFRAQAGLRGDYYTYDVTDRLENMDLERVHASGYAQQSVVSPKLNVVFSPVATFDLFGNFGMGFHSNDARGVVQNKRMHSLAALYKKEGMSEEEIDRKLEEQNFDPHHLGTSTLPQAIGAEFGARTRIGSQLNLSAALWWVDLEGEHVHIGDAGVTEEKGGSRRYGIDCEARVQLLSWLLGDADVNVSTGYLRDQPEAENEIPLAPRFSITGGLTAQHPSGYEGSIRVRHLGDRPLNEANTLTASGYTVVDGVASYNFSRYRLSLIAENLLNTSWREAQYDTETRLQFESDPVSELHFVPGYPRNFRVEIGYLF